ncbi:ATP-binding cassette domain-containing protein [Geobacter sulfurreducens]|uniref:ABC transporter, ATP-binding protein n=1 Tax=Geobacter sulfurreducens (strain ATCC 51573 / DSM 12127 / PCA) TaxID=243231 RepID=Q74BE8_GEOSL|nr:ABC-F family ATP-binding cassette domain-containing protein [Geobacter sulfurreducens]AAR35469.1 ABC transporter, ATP-binding protein [Geobacter sulfurreducens PCA]AJY68316.1 glycosyl transferase family 1 [Geobacter sulfurreducens]UAC02819.1 ATP-binding cassette domain-containing protein [Geobacter sulfurreducens]HCD97629.1 ABC transporter ATP-binding protein [Geobacter sulfurreducens]
MIHLSNITKQHGNQLLFRDASFQILPGSRTGLVGPNGAGKTTIFRIITGEEEVDAGEITCAKRTSIGYFSQDVGEMAGRTALEEVMAVSAETVRLAAELKEMEAAMAEPMDDDAMAALLERYGTAMEEFEHRGGYDLDTRARTILTGLGIGPDRYDHPVESFSGGWKMRIALAGILTLQPDVLLLDEPTNHLDVESIIWLEEWLAGEFTGALLMTSHDRDFMNRIVTRIIEVADKTVTTYGGNYDFYERERDIRREQLLASHKRQQEMLAKEEEFIARFAARASHAAQVQSRVKKLEKIDRIEIPPEERVIRFEFNDPPRSGDDVAVFNGLAKSWSLPGGGEKSVFSGVSGVIRRQNKIAVVGVNGAGKSTFLKVLAGRTEPTDGSVALGANVSLGYFSQHAMELLDPKKTVFETVQDAMPLATIGVIRNLLGAFLFSGDAVDKRIENLSGGEKSRVVLATLLARPLNFLVLDEPTNHLDIRSREILLDALQNFTGTVVLVSHDRHFLRLLVDRVFEIDHGEMRIYEGNYGYYLEKSQQLHLAAC